MKIPPVNVWLTFPKPNYVDPDTRGPALVYINIIFIAITIVTVALRIWTRVTTIRMIGWDDIWCIISLFFAVALTVSIVLANEKYHWNRHVWDIPLSEISELGVIAYIAKILYVGASGCIRHSLMCFYCRLVRDTGMRKFRLVVYFFMVFNMLMTVAFLCISVFLCHPISAYWSFPPKGKCIDEGEITFICGIFTCFIDLISTLLPIPMVLRLQMRLRQKAGVVLLLSFGFVVTIAGILRTYYIYMSLIKTWDETWYAYPLWIAAAIEIDLAVITSCAPALRPFFSTYMSPLLRPLSVLSRRLGGSSDASQPYGKGSETAKSTGISAKSKGCTPLATAIEMESAVYDGTDSRDNLVGAQYTGISIVHEVAEDSGRHNSLTLSVPSRLHHQESFEMVSSALKPASRSSPLADV